jgi:hypothetical protein
LAFKDLFISNANSSAYTDCIANTDFNANSITYTHSYTNTYFNSFTNSITHAKSYTYPNCKPHTKSIPIIIDSSDSYTHRDLYLKRFRQLHLQIQAKSPHHLH